MTITLSALQKQRRDSAANWTAENPTLLAGEIGIESDTGYWKVGDGSTAWTSLAYVSGLGAEIPVDRLADGAARQLLQTDAAGTGVEWTDDIDVPGTLDVTGAATFDDDVTITGTATAAALIPSGSSVPTNGVYLPSANNVAISTNGTGWVYVDPGGRVGIGTLSANSQVHISSANPRIELTDTDTGVDHRINADSSVGNLSFDIDYNSESASPSAIFNLKGSERLRITADGKVGLGTSSPAGPLEVAVAANRNLLVTGVDNNYTRIGGIQGGTSNNRNLNLTGESLLFSTGSSSGTSFDERLRITSDGKVGIGTTSPDAVLSLQSAIAQITLKNSAGTTKAYIGTGGAFGTAGTDDLRIRSDASNIIFGFSGFEKARIDSSGRLLVGTSTSIASSTSVNAGLQNQSNGANAASNLGRWSADATGYLHFFSKSRGTSVGSHSIVNDGDFIGVLAFEGSDGTAFVRAANIAAQVDGTPGANDMPGRLVFSTTADGASSPTERMRISNTGFHYLYGNTGVLRINSGAAAGTGTAYLEGYYGATSTLSGTRSFLVYTNGDVANTNNVYGAISDIKLKENIVDANSQWNDLKALQVRNYNFKEGQTHTQIGLVAQEAELVSPGLVSESPDLDEDGNDLGTVTKSVNYSVLYMKAVKALQEAMERIETLEQRLNDAGIA